MGWLNYHHLYYFWTTAEQGTIARAAAHLRLSEPTVGAQIHELEKALGESLFRRDGRRLVLTQAGRVAQRYASEIFSLGREFQAAITGGVDCHAPRVAVGIADVVPRLIAFRLLEPAVRSARPFSIICQNDAPDRLLAKLVAQEIDVVISDAPLDVPGKASTENLLLGECGVTLFAAAELAGRCRSGFPTSLHGEPFLLPAENTTLRRSVESWFVSCGVRPRIAGEFTDSALMKTFGRAGVGVFAAPSAIEKEVAREYRVRRIARIPELRERFYVVTARRKIDHPAVASIASSARRRLFG